MTSTSKTGTRRRYTAVEREAAVKLAAKVGVNEAARRLKVPQPTLSHWRAGRGDVGAAVSAATKTKTTTTRAKGGAGRGKRDATTQTATTSTPAAPAAPLAPRPPASRRKVVAKSYTPSQKAEAVEYAREHGVSAASKQLGVSRFSLYAWLRQVEKAAAGEGDSPTSGPAPKDVEAQRDREILDEWSKHRGLGPSQIRNQLGRAGIKVSVNTVRRVMEDAGYRPPKVKREPHDKRYEAVRPNHLWHLDFVHRHINRASTFTLILLDDYSRYVPGHGVDDAERAEMVIKTFEGAVERHGKPEAVMSDRGSAFWSWRGISRFTDLLTEMGIDHLVAQHKEHNGKVEVFNANLHKELFDAQRFYDLAEMKRRLAAHLEWHNHGRTHHALGGLLVPADRYYGRTAEVLARIEAGVPARDAHDLDLRERCLELFKVVSKGGTPEVWLLGQRLNMPLGT